MDSIVMLREQAAILRELAGLEVSVSDPLAVHMRALAQKCEDVADVLSARPRIGAPEASESAAIVLRRSR